MQWWHAFQVCTFAASWTACATSSCMPPKLLVLVGNSSKFKHVAGKTVSMNPWLQQALTLATWRPCWTTRLAIRDAKSTLGKRLPLPSTAHLRKNSLTKPWDHWDHWDLRSKQTPRTPFPEVTSAPHQIHLHPEVMTLVMTLVTSCRILSYNVMIIIWNDSLRNHE